ncbi:bifunctional heptose 7-phosphate kinase/heptose 1-phosphate adenyltransferase [Sediminibacterium ginsengisoli]|uniref:RfaE bifunctional protein, domain I n=1 Tax=Sediminibacterium ginsengisoli TaxID=413434 RepID=A0A1T4RMB0_9BACT|nr:bifunctional ADP-heptose synthase [Sediminibacterium ginsengisoli]SKA17145.1 rfaE bifunctional protein, domain I [Sediminibacterium ginsengisoli]
MMDFEQLFSDFSSSKVVIVGDVMLDTYWWGHVDRISPEAPVPVVALNRKELRVGGAANVALNTASLGAATTLISVIGKDEDGKSLTALLRSSGINTDYFVVAEDRITTNKTRVMSRNQQMMRLDAEDTGDVNDAIAAKLLEMTERLFKTDRPDVLILEDYNKGVLTPAVIEGIISLCKTYGVVTAVDPKKKNFLAFKDVDIFKPNLKEVKEGLNLSPAAIDESSLKQIHAALKQELNHRVSLITLSEKGVYFQDGQQSRIIPTHIRNIADVSGAGDTVIAVASLTYAVTKDMELAAEMANIAGGLVCEEVGTAAIDREKLLQECKMLLQ